MGRGRHQLWGVPLDPYGQAPHLPCNYGPDPSIFYANVEWEVKGKNGVGGHQGPGTTGVPGYDFQTVGRRGGLPANPKRASGHVRQPPDYDLTQPEKNRKKSNLSLGSGV